MRSFSVNAAFSQSLHTDSPGYTFIHFVINCVAWVASSWTDLLGVSLLGLDLVVLLGGHPGNRGGCPR